MDIRLLFSTCLCLTLASIVLAEINGNRNDTPDLNQIMTKFNELQKSVSLQDKRISELEKRPVEPAVQSVVELQNTVQLQKARIRDLEERIFQLESLQTNEEQKPNTSLGREMLLEANETNTNLKVNLVRKGRLLIQPTSLPIESVAFYAYISSTVPASTPHHILVFDKVITDVGNAYHPHMGTFIAPNSGLYVFTWTIRCNSNNYHSAELLADNNIVTSIYLNPGNAIDGTVTGTAVVHVDKGDDVFIRTGLLSNGNILSNENGRTSFAGWILM